MGVGPDLIEGHKSNNQNKTCNGAEREKSVSCYLPISGSSGIQFVLFLILNYEVLFYSSCILFHTGKTDKVMFHLDIITERLRVQTLCW